MDDPRWPDGATEPGEGAGAAGARSPSEDGGGEGRVRGRRRRKVAKGTVWLAALGVVGVLGFAAFLTQTTRGQRAVVEYLLDRIRANLQGDLTVGEIRSPGLLGGVTLLDVTLTAGGGDPFLHVDSIYLRYSPWTLLSGRPTFSVARGWGMDVEIASYFEDQELNVARLLKPAPPAADSATSGFVLGISTLEIVSGEVRVLTPADPDTRRTFPNPRGGPPLKRTLLDDLAVTLDDVVIDAARPDFFQGFLADFRTDVYILDEPLRVVGAQGRATFGDDGLAVRDGFFRLPASVYEGDLELGPQATGGDEWALSLDLDSQGPAALADLAWMDPRVPDGTVRGGAAITVGEVMDIRLRDVLIELEASRLRLDGGIVYDDVATLQELEVEASPVVIDRLEPWLERTLPVDGFLSGNATLSGTLASMAVDGRVTLAPAGFQGRPTTAVVNGRVHLGDDPGATGLRARLDPLNYSLLNAIEPGLVDPARGSADIRATGRLSRGVEFTAQLVHRPDVGAESRVRGEGSVRRRGDRWVTDVAADLQPLDLALLARAAPDAGLVGSTTGTVRVFGPLRDLEVGADLALGGGRMLVDGRVNARDPAQRYRLDIRLDGVDLERVATTMPDRTVLTGTVLVDGSGLDPERAELTAEVVSGSSRLAGLWVDTVQASGRVSGGMLTVDTLVAALSDIRVAGGGTLGLVGLREGSARLHFESDSITRLRALFLGDTVIAGDTLTALDRMVLEGQGMDLSDLPDSADVAMSGSLRGEVELRGSLEALDVSGYGVLRNVRYGPHRVDSATVTVAARGLPSLAASTDVTLQATGLTVAGRDFQVVNSTVSIGGRAGTGVVDAVLGENQVIHAAGEFSFDSTWAGTVDLTEAYAELDTLRYDMVGASTISWDSTSVVVEELSLVRDGDPPMRLYADGALSRDGTSDFVLEAEGVHLESAAALALAENLDISGLLEANLRVTGSLRAPVVEGSFEVANPRYRSVELDSIGGRVAYASRSTDLSFSAWRGSREVFRVDGDIPLDLGVGNQTAVLMDEPMDVRVVADSLDASVALSYLTFLEEVEGTVSGDFRIRGTVERPIPGGVLSISDGAWTMEAIGVRHEDIVGTLTLNPDQTVAVALEGRANGTVRVTGNVVLQPLINPDLDLDIAFSDFQAVDRRDVEGRISGDLDLTGTYDRPVITGTLTVDRGTLFLEEFSRSSEVIDLTDPRLLSLVDTSAFSGRPLLAAVRNPFLDNLRMDVELNVPRDTWIRSREMNVEIGGQLLVSYDRRQRDVVMVGELEALRGSYTIVGRTFDVETGTVSFIGTPGINPRLEIQASTRIRRPAQDNALEVTATVQGTLAQPRVELATDEAGVAESDLISYLVFGRPSHQLAAQGAGATGGVLGTGLDLGVNVFTGSLYSQLGSLIAQEAGLDYLNISQAGVLGVTSGILGAPGSIQAELGKYLSNDVFLVIVLRPLDTRPVAGARIEIALSDFYHLEAFIEDRFLRSAVGNFDEFGFTTERIVGVFIYREWGY